MAALGVDVPVLEWDTYDRQAFAHVWHFVERSIRAQRHRELLRAFDEAGIAVDLRHHGVGSLVRDLTATKSQEAAA
jgi:hypothetical protein